MGEIVLSLATPRPPHALATGAAPADCDELPFFDVGEPTPEC